MYNVMYVSFNIGFGNPTSVDFVATDLHQMVASYTTARTVLFDVETGKSVLNLDSATTYGETDTWPHAHACIVRYRTNGF